VGLFDTAMGSESRVRFPHDPDLVAAVEQALIALPAQQREVLLLARAGSSFTEVARELGIAPESVRSSCLSAMTSIQGALALRRRERAGGS